MSIGRRLARGAAWMVAARFVDKILGLVSTLVLARLLVPEDFGLVAIAMAMVALLHVLTNFSFDYVLIQHPAPTREHFDTAWSIGLAFGAAIAAVLGVLAIPAASFYGEPRLVDVMLIVAATAFIGSLSNIGCVNFRRDLRFEKDFLLGLYRRLGSLPVTLGLAFWLRDYRALVFGAMASAFIGVLISYLMHPFRPRLSLRHRAELIGFSKWLFVMNLLGFLNVRAADFLIGKFRGPHQLGLFSLANEVAMLPSTELVAPINRAAFPSYSRVASNPAEVSQLYLRVIGGIALVVLPVAVGFSLTAQHLVPLLFGRKWLEAVPLFQLLALASACFALWTNTGYVLMALGRPHKTAALYGFQATATVTALAVALWLDVPNGVGWALLGVAVATVFPNVYMWRSELNVKIRAIVAQVWRPMLACAAMAAVVLWLRPHLGDSRTATAHLWALASIAGVGASVYVAMLAALWTASGRPTGAESFVLDLAAERFGRRA